jgi:hypothetical protein
LTEEIARMIECHNDHDDATKKIDRFDADAFGCDGFGYGCHVGA